MTMSPSHTPLGVESYLSSSCDLNGLSCSISYETRMWGGFLLYNLRLGSLSQG